LIWTEQGMETFLTKNGTGDGKVVWLSTPRTEWDDCSLTKNGTEWYVTRTERIEKKERKRNDLAEHPQSRWELNNF